MPRSRKAWRARVLASSRSLLHHGLWPAAVLVALAGFGVGFHTGFVDVSLAAVPLVVGLVLFACEGVAPDRRGRGVWGDPQALNDLAHGALGQGVGNALGQATFVFGAAWLAGEVSTRFGTRLWPSEASRWIQIPLLIFLADGLDYARHRLEHRVSWLWPIHALHHDVDRMNLLKSSRGHGLDMVFRSLMVYAPFALLGAPRDVLMSYAAAVSVLGPVAHANLRMHVPAWLHRWVMTPQVHRIHHARPQALSRSNYANVFPIWDVLFGTYQPPDPERTFEYGIEEPRQPEGFAGQLVAPFEDWGWRRRAGSDGRRPPQALVSRAWPSPKPPIPSRSRPTRPWSTGTARTSSDTTTSSISSIALPGTTTPSSGSS